MKPEPNVCVLHSEQLSISSSIFLRMGGNTWKVFVGWFVGCGDTQTDKPVPGRRTLVQEGDPQRVSQFGTGK